MTQKLLGLFPSVERLCVLPRNTSVASLSLSIPLLLALPLVGRHQAPPPSCLFVPFLLWVVVSQFFALCLPSVWAHRLKAATAPGASPSDGSEEEGVVVWRRSKAGGQYPPGFLPELPACSQASRSRCNPGAHSPAGSFTKGQRFIVNGTSVRYAAFRFALQR